MGSSGSLVECNGDASCAGDVQGHGTHCAGTAVGTVYGVAPSAQTRSVKVLSDSGSGAWDWSYQALDWLATNPVLLPLSHAPPIALPHCQPESERSGVDVRVVPT